MATRLHWYRRFPEAALNGMKRLSLEERGAYNTVLDLIYAHGGELDDDDRFIAGWCSCDVRTWRRIKVRLLGLDKIYTTSGKLRNGRADEEVVTALARVASATDAGIQSGRARAAKSGGVSNGSKDLAPTDAPTNGQRPLQPLRNPESRIPLSENLTDAARPPAPNGAASRTAPASDEPWQQRLDGYARGGKWMTQLWGPKPGEKGCHVPKEFLTVEHRMKTMGNA